MDSNIWGPHAWLFLHTITLNYPDKPTEKEMIDHKNFFISLKDILPCEKCRKHYEINLDKFPLTEKILSSKSNITKWLIDIHNSVNINNNKKVKSHEEVLKYYKKIYDKKGNNKRIILIVLIIMIFVFIAYSFYMFLNFIKVNL